MRRQEEEQERSVREGFLSDCCENNLTAVARLLEEGADVNWRDEDGMSGLHWAAVNNYGALLARLLTEPTVSVNITNTQGETPLMMASFAGRDGLVSRLCGSEGIELNCRDVNGWTALHWAVDQSRTGCVQILSDSRADCNVLNSEWEAPVMLSLKQHKSQLAVILLNNPSLDLDTVDGDGRHLEDIAW